MAASEGTKKFTERISHRLVEYVTAVQAALTWEPGRVIYLAPGAEVAWDECCEGQLWIRIASITPTQAQRDAPRRNVGAAGVCGITHFIVAVEIGLLRCASVVNDAGEAPPAAVITNEGLATLEDSAAILQAITCSKHTRQVGRYQPVGPQGGCVGGVWSFDMRVDNCIECPEG